MLQVDLTASVRRTFGKSRARSLRMADKTPAVLYGPHVDSLALELPSKILTKALLGIQRQNAVISLDIQDGDAVSKRHVMIREIQSDPVSGTLIHADFYEISLEKPIRLWVDVRYTGKAKGFDAGGELQISKSKVYMEGIPMDFPDFIEADISQMDLGDTIACKDLTLPGKVTLLESEKTVCASVVLSSVKEGEPSEQEAKPEGESSEGKAAANSASK